LSIGRRSADNSWSGSMLTAFSIAGEYQASTDTSDQAQAPTAERNSAAFVTVYCDQAIATKGWSLRLHLIGVHILPDHYESKPFIHRPCRIDLHYAQTKPSPLASRVVEKFHDEVGADSSALELWLDHHHFEHRVAGSFQQARRAHGSSIDHDHPESLPRQMLPKCLTLKFLVPAPSLLNIFVHRSLVASVEKRHVDRLRRPHRVGRWQYQASRNVAQFSHQAPTKGTDPAA
jgi:hypothetical protein